MRRACHHPGAYLQELLIWRPLGAEDLAREIEMPCRAIVQLSVAPRAAYRRLSGGLAGYFGNSARFRLDLQVRRDRAGAD